MPARSGGLVAPVSDCPDHASLGCALVGLTRPTPEIVSRVDIASIPARSPHDIGDIRSVVVAIWRQRSDTVVGSVAVRPEQSGDVG